ncbi:ParB N-terminal domain-containing protein [Flammeovirga yaeyamensis]|uniref:ParB N-terminal domain-containing protein n=1 Tax=Flammeovirga yaeyamensis TaxID=367791 RepID=A0AAX1NCE6_9BACT|nr:ParB N-terminal domain-containing protein [Flammeovirga yaeyamensis]MBB3696929.1 ParB-like chromosome segregation protein Spo0J [Flammeovirga yaeyamensis]NMF33592.1 ParB N-terminal domain-containing protein [Flammeovirga yaeyamensis]QWG05140.1 ParB N-terminal domain-containing protein [Flammeovirga yaeyamensis]
MLNLDKFKKKEEEKHREGKTSLREKESSEKLTQVDFKSPGAFHIEPEYRELIRKQTPDEARNFEKSIKEEGVREPILYWTHTLRDENGAARLVHTVVDGHHRCEAAVKLGLAYIPCKELKFNSHNDVRIWMLRNQLGRRNIGDAEKITIALQLTEFLGVEAKERKKKQVESFNKKETVQKETAKEIQPVEKSEDELELDQFKDTLNLDASGRINRAEEAAKIAGVSTKNVTKMKKVIEKGGEDIVKSVINGDLSIHKAWSDIRAVEKQEKEKAKGEAKPKKVNLTPKVIQSLLHNKELVNGIAKVGYAFRNPKEKFDNITLDQVKVNHINDFALRFFEEGKEVKQAKNIDVVQFIKLSESDLFPLIVGYQIVSTLDDLEYIDSLSTYTAYTHKMYIVVKDKLTKSAIKKIEKDKLKIGVISVSETQESNVEHESHYLALSMENEFHMLRESVLHSVSSL